MREFECEQHLQGGSQLPATVLWRAITSLVANGQANFLIAAQVLSWNAFDVSFICTGEEDTVDDHIDRYE